MLGLLSSALRWSGDDRFPAFFVWKHLENAFGPSPAWVAVDQAKVVGFRAFLRWELESDGEVLRVVRAVDTATDPDHQRQGIFSRLTRQALTELADEGVAFVFNTPNEKSRPGYLKMGWSDVGRLPLVARPRSLRALARVVQARQVAERWSLPTPAGVAAGEALADTDRVTAILGSQPRRAGMHTNRHASFLGWRYGFEPLRYRAMPAGRDLDDGFAVFRLRRRGTATEAAVADVLVPGADPRLAAQALRKVASAEGVDYAIALNPPGSHRAGFLPALGQGPRLVWRGLNRTEKPPPRSWDLALADVELF